MHTRTRSALIIVATIVAVVIAAATIYRSWAQTPPAAISCGRICNSNLECRGDPLGRCPFCNFGSCRGNPPVAPPGDAGVDAAVDAGR